MINNLNILLPEIFLSISILSILMVGVFTKNSYNIVTKLSLLALIVTGFLITGHENKITKIFSDSFVIPLLLHGPTVDPVQFQINQAQHPRPLQYV